MPDQALIDVEVGQHVIILRFHPSRVDETFGIFPPKGDDVDIDRLIQDAVEEHAEHAAREGLAE